MFPQPTSFHHSPRHRFRGALAALTAAVLLLVQWQVHAPMALAAAFPAGSSSADFCSARSAPSPAAPSPIGDRRSSATFCDLCKVFADVPAPEPARVAAPALATPAPPSSVPPSVLPRAVLGRARHPARAPPILPA